MAEKKNERLSADELLRRLKENIGEDAPDLEAVKRSRGDGGRSRMGKNVLEVCAAADILAELL